MKQMSAPRKALRVETSPSGRRYVDIKEVVRGELERIRQKERETQRPTSDNGCQPPQEPRDNKDK